MSLLDVQTEENLSKKIFVKENSEYKSSSEPIIVKQKKFIYDDTTCTEELLRKFLPFTAVINCKDCITFSMPNLLRFADQISDILVFIIFQNASSFITKVLSLILFVLTAMSGGIRWFVSLREVKVTSKETVFRKVLLFLYIVPIFGVPAHFFYDMYSSVIVPLIRPRYLHTLPDPQKEIAEMEFNALLELLAESLVSSIIGALLFIFAEEDRGQYDMPLLIVSTCISIYSVIKNANLIRKKAEIHGYDWIEYIYIRIQYAESSPPTFFPFLGKLRSKTATDVNYAATQFVDSDIAILEKHMSPVINSSELLPVKRFQFSLFTLSKLSQNAIYRLGSIFHSRTDIQLFLVKICTMADFDDLWDDYRSDSSSNTILYERDFCKEILFQTVGCIGKASIRLEESREYCNRLFDAGKYEHRCFQETFLCFLCGCFKIDYGRVKIPSQEAFQIALDSKDLRAIEFMLGKGGIDPTHASIEIDGVTKNALVYCLDSELYDVVDLLVASGADLNADFGSNGGELKLLFKFINSRSILLKLLDLGINIYIKDSENHNALYYCTQRDDYDFLMDLGIEEDEYSFCQNLERPSLLMLQTLFDSKTWKWSIVECIAMFLATIDKAGGESTHRGDIAKLKRSNKKLKSDLINSLDANLSKDKDIEALEDYCEDMQVAMDEMKMKMCALQTQRKVENDIMRAKYVAAQERLTEKQIEIDEMKTEMEELEEHKKDLQIQWNQTKTNYNKLLAKNEKLEEDFEKEKKATKVAEIAIEQLKRYNAEVQKL